MKIEIFFHLFYLCKSLVNKGFDRIGKLMKKIFSKNVLLKKKFRYIIDPELKKGLSIKLSKVRKNFYNNLLQRGCASLLENNLNIFKGEISNEKVFSSIIYSTNGIRACCLWF